MNWLIMSHLIKIQAVCKFSYFHLLHLKSLITKNRCQYFRPLNFQKMLRPSYIILRIQRLDLANSEDLDEVGHYMLPQELHCFQIQIFSC